MSRCLSGVAAADLREELDHSLHSHSACTFDFDLAGRYSSIKCPTQHSAVRVSSRFPRLLSPAGGRGRAGPPVGDGRRHCRRVKSKSDTNNVYQCTVCMGISIRKRNLVLDKTECRFAVLDKNLDRMPRSRIKFIVPRGIGKPLATGYGLAYLNCVTVLCTHISTRYPC